MSKGLWLLLAGCLIGCESASQNHALLTVANRDWQETVLARGEIVSAKVTPLNVPGQGFELRQVLSLINDGSRVQKGDLIARFDAPSVQKELSTLELDLLRNTLLSAAQRNQKRMTEVQLDTEIADVESQLSLSERYALSQAGAEVIGISKNELLDKLQDLGYLKDRRGTLEWREGQLITRARADASVIGAQRLTIADSVGSKRASLAQLEVHAPHAGVLRLTSNWDGSKLQTGGSTWAGDDFANLPDLSELVARFSVPQASSENLKAGMRAVLQLAGSGTLINATVTRVGASASVKNRESPVKYVEFDVAIPNVKTTELALTPGQAMAVTVYTVDRKNVLAVANLSVVTNAGRTQVQTADGSWLPVTLGEKGASLSEVVAGLSLGAQIRLNPERAPAAAETGPAPTSAARP